MISPGQGCCKTLRFSGVDQYLQVKKMGLYDLTGRSHAGKPVYRKRNNGDYLYYFDNQWLVGPDYTKDDAGIRASHNSNPSCPTDAQEWFQYDGDDFVDGPGIQVECVTAGMACAFTCLHVTSPKRAFKLLKF